MYEDALGRYIRCLLLLTPLAVSLFQASTRQLLDTRGIEDGLVVQEGLTRNVAQSHLSQVLQGKSELNASATVLQVAINDQASLLQVARNGSEQTFSSNIRMAQLNEWDAAALVSQRQESSLRTDSKIHVVVITDKPGDDRVAVLNESLHAAGFGTVNFQRPAPGSFTWLERLRIMHQIVQDAAENDPESIFMFLDAFDTFALGGPKELRKKFEETAHDALFSCVTYPYPQTCSGLDWQRNGTCRPNQWGAQCKHWCRFACAGAFMAKPGMLAKIFADHPLNNSVIDDQCYFNKVFAKSNYNITLDYEQSVFFSTAALLNCSLERKGGRLQVTRTGAQPSVIHLDNRHPTASVLRHFWQEAAKGSDGPVCKGVKVCTDWCWNLDFFDMPQRLTEYNWRTLRESIGGTMVEFFRWRSLLSIEIAIAAALVLGGMILVACRLAYARKPA